MYNNKTFFLQHQGHLTTHLLGWVIESSVACTHEESSVVEAHFVVSGANLSEILSIQTVVEIGRIAPGIEIAVKTEINLASLSLLFNS